MNILISNDDGITSPGLKKLCEALSGIPGMSLFVCAPDGERSCIGHGLTMFNDLYIEDHPADSLGSSVVWAKKCSGTPGDCVRLALCILNEQGVKPDLICAGINIGLNTGSDIYYSGTLAAAREAVLDGYPAMAFSISRGLDYLDNFSIIVPEIVTRFAGKLPQDHLLNVNAPNIPWSSIKGFKAAQLAHQTYPQNYTLMDDSSDETGSGTTGDPSAAKRQRYAFASFSMQQKDADSDDDCTLINEGYITVTVIPLLPDTKSTKPVAEDILNSGHLREQP